jgi:hypothetical protein
MRRLRVTVLDLATKGPIRSVWGRLMQPNFASLMPQAVAVWCEEAGHEVRFACYTGSEDLVAEVPAGTDIVFIATYTQSAQLAYALSNVYRQRGVRTVIGGPHARCYPDDAALYFDYVLGFTDKETVLEVLRDCAPHRPGGLHLSAARQPSHLPGVRERWKYIAPTIAKTPVLKLIPMIGSLGCPYTCSFCIDSTVAYQTLDGNQIRDDLRFLLGQMPRPLVGWHDPNFGVRFDEIMEVIESAVPPGRMDFVAESSLSLLSEAHLKRLQRNGFQAILPGVESWYGMGGKSKTGGNTGHEKMRQVSEHLNTILRYIPYVQANFVLGLDSDEGEEPFELTRQFIDLTPGVFPAYSLLSAFGQAAPLNLDLQRAGRVLPTPFHFLDNNRATNVRPKNYSWASLYDNVIGLRKHSFSWRAVGRRLQANRGALPRFLNAVRAMSSEGSGRIQYDSTLRRRLDSDASLRSYLDGETTTLPGFYTDQVRRDLGSFWEALPAGALRHDPNAYLRSHEARLTVPAEAAVPAPAVAVAAPA